MERVPITAYFYIFREVRFLHRLKVSISSGVLGSHDGRDKNDEKVNSLLYSLISLRPSSNPTYESSDY